VTIPNDQVIVCGVAPGPDENDRFDTQHAVRESVESFAPASIST
jgi:hypothetical protein